MSVTIRPSRVADFETLWRIDQLCFPPDQAYSRLELSVYMKRRGAFTLVAETDIPAKIAGFIVAEANTRGQGHIVTIDVLEGARRGGVGSQLMRAAEKRLGDEACRNVSLETAVDNEAALLFYKRQGYFVEKTIPRYYNGTLDALLMRKDLLPSAPAK